MAGKLPESGDIERLRMLHAFWLAVVGLVLSVLLAGFVTYYAKVKHEPADVVALIGLFTSVIGTLVGAFFGVHIGAAGAERDRQSRHEAEGIARAALAHLHPDTARDLLAAHGKQAPSG